MAESPQIMSNNKDTNNQKSPDRISGAFILSEVLTESSNLI